VVFLPHSYETSIVSARLEQGPAGAEGPKNKNCLISLVGPVFRASLVRVYFTKAEVIEAVAIAQHGNGSLSRLPYPPPESAAADVRARIQRRIHIRLENSRDALLIVLGNLLSDVPDDSPLSDEHFNRVRSHLQSIRDALSCHRWLREFTRRLYQAKIEKLDQLRSAARSEGKIAS